MRKLSQCLTVLFVSSFAARPMFAQELETRSRCKR